MTAVDDSTTALTGSVIRLDSARGRGQRGERRVADTVAELSRRHDTLCASAVDTWEIAAGLEAQGMSDRDCLAYGYPDVFALAEALFDAVPSGGSGRPTDSSRPLVRPWLSLLRGLIYALPAIVGLGAVSDRGAPAVTVLIVALAAGWGWSQALSFLGHRNLGWIGDLAARAIMRSGLLCGLVIVPVVVLVATRLAGASFGTAASGSAIGIYMVAAGVLLVFGDELALLAALVPGSVAGVLLLLGVGPWGASVHSLIAAFSVLSVLALALHATSTRALTGSGTTQTRPRWLPDRADLLAALPHLGYGVAAAAAVGLGPSTLELFRGGASSASWYVTLPVVLSMGAAELQLERLMHRTHMDLGTVASPDRFARLSRRALATAIGHYLSVVAALSVLAIFLGSGGRPETDQVVLVAGYAALAACFFIALTLVAIGRVLVAGCCMVVALGSYLLLAQTSLLASATAYLVTFGLMFVVLLTNAAVRLRNPLVHL
ncbi:hypothetical protein V3N99_19860 [Dermatophilaceae bacterium Soc4.6]